MTALSILCSIDFSNVFQGLLVSKPEQFVNADKFILLWLHESERVYGDRLVNASDLAKYNSLVQSQCKKNVTRHTYLYFFQNDTLNTLPRRYEIGMQEKILIEFY